MITMKGTKDYGRSAQMDTPITITIVDESRCPGCNGGDEFYNRPKVGLEDGWWWKCYNPNCKVGYYNPETQMFEPRGSLSGHYPYSKASSLDQSEGIL